MRYTLYSKEYIPINSILQNRIEPNIYIFFYHSVVLPLKAHGSKVLGDYVMFGLHLRKCVQFSSVQSLSRV